MDKAEARHLKLMELVRQFPSKSAFADAVGMSRDQLSQLLSRKRNIGDRLAAKIERRLNLTDGSLSMLTIEQNAQLIGHNLDNPKQTLVELLQSSTLPREDVAVLLHVVRKFLEHSRSTSQ